MESRSRCIQYRSGTVLHEFLGKFTLSCRILPQFLRFDSHDALEELQDHETDDPSYVREEAHREKMAYTRDIAEKMNQRWKRMHVLSAHWRAQSELEGVFNYLEL
jgi:hypothetical protein